MVAAYLKKHPGFSDITDPVTPKILQWVAALEFLPGGQLGDEAVHDSSTRRCTSGPDDEFRQARLHVTVELAVQLIPARGDQLLRIDVRRRLRTAAATSVSPPSPTASEMP